METVKFNIDGGYETINFDESLNLKCRHAAHCCIYSPNSFPLFESYVSKAYISMQMRFDGSLGFPGGIITEDDTKSIDSCTVIDGLNRELVEETNLDDRFFITRADHCLTHYHKEKNACYHFFSKEVTEEQFTEIERKSLNAEYFGKEVMGFLRVPLITMKDNVRGFPKFLTNSFAGSGKSQLLHFLLDKKLVSSDYITESLSKSVA